MQSNWGNSVGPLVPNTPAPLPVAGTAVAAAWCEDGHAAPPMTMLLADGHPGAFTPEGATSAPANPDGFGIQAAESDLPAAALGRVEVTDAASMLSIFLKWQQEDLRPSQHLMNRLATWQLVSLLRSADTLPASRRLLGKKVVR
jgi:hypothetical protein